jgi:F-type H+-transporting ATPase subunit delta
MSVIRIASRYAKSLIDLAVEQDKLERVLEDVKTFQKAVSNREFYLLLKSPIINATKKQQIFKALFGDKFDEMTSAFFKIILTKGREAYLPDIADEFVNQYKDIKHISTVRLTTAVPLGAETISRLKQKLVASSATEDHVELVTKVDPDILGGFVIEFDDKLYDSSVTHKMELLRKEFAKNLFVKSY